MGPRLRFDRGARYGAAVATGMFAAYLAVSTDFSAVVQSESYTGTIRTDIPLLNIVQFLVILFAMVAALAMLPTRVAGRIGGVVLASVVLLLWTALGLERGAGALVHPVALWSVVLDQGFVTLLAAVGGWVIARGRHPLAWSVTVVALVPPLVAAALGGVDLPEGAETLIMLGVVAVAGLGAVWAAAAIDGWAERRRGVSETRRRRSAA